MKLFNFYSNFILQHRRFFIILVQILLVPLSYFLAFLLRFDFYIDQALVIEPFLKTVPLLIVSRFIFFYY